MNSPVTDERLAYLIAAHANPENWGHSKETVAALTDYATLRRQLREAGGGSARRRSGIVLNGA